MKARAKHWINYNGAWHAAGETFDIEPADAKQIEACAEILANATEASAAAAIETAQETPAGDGQTVRCGRRRRAEE